jgi:hypothetical protein
VRTAEHPQIFVRLCVQRKHGAEARFGAIPVAAVLERGMAEVALRLHADSDWMTPPIADLIHMKKPALSAWFKSRWRDRGLRRKAMPLVIPAALPASAWLLAEFDCHGGWHATF